MALEGGNQGSFTYAGITTIQQVAWTGEFIKRERITTPFGYAGVRRHTALVDASGTFTIFSNSAEATPPIPSGSVGTLVLVASTGRTYTLSAVLTVMGRTVNISVANENAVTYRWALSSQSSASPITVASTV